jgi:hypothetical protein
MKRVTLIAFLCAILSVSTMGQARNNKDILITIERGGCYGNCPVYSATIFSDGTVEYEGRHFVKAEGKRTHKIGKERIEKLISALQKADYFDLKNEYRVDENGISITDQPTTTTSFNYNGKRKQVVDYYCSPKKLIELETKIEELAGLFEYIGPL